MFQQLSLNQQRRPAPVRLSSIIDDVPVLAMSGPYDAEIAGITTDSRAVADRWLFVAAEGEHTDGHRFVQAAIERGAGTVVVQRRQFEAGLRTLLTPSYTQHHAATVVIVEDTRIACAILADRFYGSPAKRLRLVGITGTNGKTTTAFLTQAVLEAAGMRTGLIGTVEYRIGKRRIPAPFTTPPAEELHRVFADMVAEGCTAAVMEVSSHALALKRVHGLRFDVSLFTNLTQDHLDFHGGMDAYRDAKALLFTRHTGGRGIVNADDPASASIGVSLGRKRLLYGSSGRCAFAMRDVASTAGGTTVVVRHGGRDAVIVSRLAGAFNAYNLTAAFAICSTLGVDDETIVRGLRRVAAVPGRFERIRARDGVTAIVDYAHTPDALTKAVAAARALLRTGGRLITVFGCGGDRDHGKRPLMGAAASSGSDLTIVTSDNPRSEDPDAIITAIMEGIVPGAEVVWKTKRREAIRLAIRVAKPGDIVLVAGKGHETYQIIGAKRTQFDDREIIRAAYTSYHGGTRG